MHNVNYAWSPLERSNYVNFLKKKKEKKKETFKINFKKTKSVYKAQKVVTILYHNKIYTSEPYKENVA